MMESAPVTPNIPAAPSSADASTAAGVAQSNAPASVTGNTKINSLQDLKRKAPKVYNMMMISIQEMVRRKMQKHQENLKKAIRGQG
jgi:BarA-like signal transduction histidine kinase